MTLSDYIAILITIAIFAVAIIIDHAFKIHDEIERIRARGHTSRTKSEPPAPPNGPRIV